MSPTFIFPPNLAALEQQDSGDDASVLSVQHSTCISSLRPSDLEEFVKGISFDLSDKELFCVEEQDVFDRIYSLVKCFGDLTPGSKLNIVESLRSNFSVLLPNIDSLFRAPASPASGSGCGDGGGVLDRVNSHRNAFIGIGYQVVVVVS